MKEPDKPNNDHPNSYPPHDPIFHLPPPLSLQELIACYSLGRDAKYQRQQAEPS